jgi:lantibiotic modifying enzyme
MEFIEHRPCGSELGAHRYYRRAGGLICAAYLLRAIDCHRDNLIAAGDQPVLIDMETLLHGATADASREHGGPLTQTSLLPIPSSLSGASDDISAFGGTHGRHTPRLAGSFIAPSNYSADMERGFWEMWKIIGEPSTKKGAAFRRRVRRLGSRPWRRMHRSTRSYYEVRERSLKPEALRSGLTRSRRITLDLLRPGVSASVILEEMSAIGRFDIPYFLSVPSSDALHANYSPLSNLLSAIRSALVPA